jgi:hypothetical protein
VFDLATTIGHETSHAMDDQDQQDPDPDINTSTSASASTNQQNDASKTDNEIYADNYGDDFGDYVEFASENYGDGNLANTNNITPLTSAFANCCVCSRVRLGSVKALASVGLLAIYNI